ncbi:MAG: DUF1467 family protein [Pseudomonadota bacterium]
MSVITVVAIYFLIWWLVFFAVLPVGVKTPEEDGSEVLQGTVESAPARPMLIKKAIATSVISGVILAIIWWFASTGQLSLDSIPFLPRFD